MFRSTMHVFKPLFGLVGAERGVKQLNHHIEWTPERTRSWICLPVPIEHSQNDVETTSP